MLCVSRVCIGHMTFILPLNVIIIAFRHKCIQASIILILIYACCVVLPADVFFLFSADYKHAALVLQLFVELLLPT